MFTFILTFLHKFKEKEIQKFLVNHNTHDGNTGESKFQMNIINCQKKNLRRNQQKKENEAMALNVKRELFFQTSDVPAIDRTIFYCSP